MQEKQELALMEHYFQLVLKKRWYVIIPFCLAVAGGFGWAIKAPRVYEAKTLILVEPQQVPGEFVKSIIPHDDMGSRIATLSQQIMSRSNLEKIIAQFRLFSGTESQKTYMEDKLDSLRARIKVQVMMKSENTGNAFSISFRDSNPELSMKVANALSTYFIEGNLQSREEQAEGTTNFLEAELETIKVRMEEVEFELKEFRQRYMGELPEQLDANLRILETLQRQLEERKERLRDTKNRLMMVEKEVEQTSLELKKKERQVTASMYGDKAAPTLQMLYDELADMQSTYTEMHPDVIRLRKKIQDMEVLQQKKKRIAGASTRISAEGEDEGESGLSVYPKPLREKMQQRLIEQLEIGKLQQDIGKIENEMRSYQQRIERTPKREGELIALKRDYDNIQNTYRSLLNRKLEANIAVNLEKKKKGEQFRILDYAKLPEKPVSPDIRDIFLKSLLGGLGIGTAIIVLFQFLDPSIQRKENIVELGVPLLVTIPKIYNDRAKMLRRVNNIASLFSVVVAGLLATGFAIVALNGIML